MIFNFILFPRPPKLIRKSCPPEKPIFRINHLVFGAGLVIDYDVWNDSTPTYLYKVEFDSGLSTNVFSSACNLEV